MSIVLNEKEWVEEVLANRRLGINTSETLGRVSRYYYEKGYSKGDIREKLDDFLIQCDPGVALVKWTDTLDWFTKNADKRSLIKINEIPVTKGELETIGSLSGRQLKRLAFTLLCVAKYWNIANTNNSGWVNAPDKEVMKMANINTSIRRQSEMLRVMKEAGLIGYSNRVDNLNIQVKYIDGTSPAVLYISDFRNLGSQYMMYLGEPYFKCSQCEITIKKNSNSHKYCESCAREMYIKKTVECVMRQREKEKRDSRK